MLILPPMSCVPISILCALSLKWTVRVRTCCWGRVIGVALDGIVLVAEHKRDRKV